MYEVSPAELAELQWKYEEMLRLRLEDQVHPGGDPRRDMAALAERFPGSLREIDELSLETIGARIAALSRCVGGEEAAEPWMLASARFHRLMRGALIAKRWLGSRRIVDSETAEAFLASLPSKARGEDARLWVGALDGVARPPRGRLSALVFDRLAIELDISSKEARERVLGTRLLRRPRGGGRSF
jgi:hypothetical protein